MIGLIIFASATMFATLAAIGIDSFVTYRKPGPSISLTIVTSLITTSVA